MRTWLAGHLSWLVCALLALWAPPLLFTLGVDLGIITEAASGFPRITDISVLTSVLQLLLMSAALPGLSAGKPRAWRLLAGASVAWAAHVAWMLLSRVRLSGLASLAASESLVALGGLAAAVVVLFAVREHYRERRSFDPFGRAEPRVAPGAPAHVP